MNWTHRRPFRQQFNYGGAMNKVSINRPLAYHVPIDIRDQPIDAIRLQLADYDNSHHRCPVHHREEHHSYRDHPYITSLSDQQSSVRRTRSSIHSVSTIETDFVHQRVSTIHTYPTSPSIIERQAIIDEDNNNNNNNNQITNNENEINVDVLPIQQEEEEQQQQQQQSNQCRTCLMLIEIVDQQAQQIRQYTEQISQQADLLAKLARRIAGIEEGIDDQKSDHTNGPITT